DPLHRLVARKGLWESFDGGATVTRIRAPQPSGFQVSALAFGAKAADGSDASNVIYEARGNRIAVRGQVARTPGNPQTLVNAFGADVSIPSAATITRIVVDPSNWRIAYAIDETHVFVTTDGGTTWVEITGAATRTGSLPLDRLNGLTLAKVT